MNRARLTPILVGVAVLVLAAILLSSGGGEEYTVKAEFTNAGGLRKNASVKVAGVPAGKVKKVEITGRDTAMATLALDKEAAPIGAGAKIQIRPTDLLGERYADMDTGDTSRPQPSGSLIPLKNTSTPVELDDVLNMLDTDTRTRVRILINEFGIGLGARGKDFNQLLVELPPAVDKSKALLAEVAAENVKLKSLITQGDRITATIHGRRDKLSELVKQASGGLRAVAARRQALGATVANAPGALTQLRATLTRLDSASQSLRPAAADLRRAAPPLTATLRALPAFAKSAKGTLAKARSVSPSLRRLGVGATPTVKRLQPTSGLLKDLGTEATPSLAHLDRRGMEDLLQFVQGWARGMKGRDNLGHFIGALAIGNEQVFLSAIDSYASGLASTPVSGRHKRAKTPALHLPKVPAGRTAPNLRLPRLPKVALPKLDAKKIKELPEALGRKLGELTGRESQPPRQQKQSSGSDVLRLFDYLFGS
jgi:phospholipid/cholesterol/gamma-HCH transport system substrate-binding protein